MLARSSVAENEVRSRRRVGERKGPGRWLGEIMDRQ